MNVKLAILCSRLWGGGFLGMWVSRGVFDRGPGELAFDIAAQVCLFGGLTYVLLGLAYVLARPEDTAST